ncbi:MAG: gamma-glutamyltransferase [Wenzhouxiangella sp.]
MQTTSSASAGWRAASGHHATTAAAVEVLEAGGNAADAAIAAAFSATVAEPLLCSVGGGTHAVVHRRGRAPVALDAFVHTPRRRRSSDLDFYPITGDFGPDTQEFHVGMAAIATPGMLAGIEALHERHGSMPLKELVAPAARLARAGVELNEIQHYTLRILEPIVRASNGSARLFGMRDRRDRLPGLGAHLHNPDLADFLEQLGRSGCGWFYRGEPALRLARDAAEFGGHLGPDDLTRYRARWRRPLAWNYRGSRIWSTPPPAFGGAMLALASSLLESHLPAGSTFGSAAHLEALTRAMAESESLRRHLERPETLHCERTLARSLRELLDGGPQAARGTTQISIDDGCGLAVSMTLSNGEGSGYVLPGTGVMLNNMLGEEDINRAGFHAWPANRRLASMMAPMILARGDSRYLLGSGGSNRIRTALAQVICNLVDFDMPLAAAVEAPRMHLEAGRLGIEMPPDGWPPATGDWLDAHFPGANRWPGLNMYFGGVHAVGPDGGAADPRRMGAAARA